MNTLRNPLLLLTTVLTAALVPTADATSSLNVSGHVGALIGGTSDGYDQSLQPAYATDLLTRSATTTDTAGSFVDPHDPDLTATCSASSTARFGLLTETAAVASKGYAASADAGDGGAVARGFDVITVHGGGPLTLTLHTRLAGESAYSDDANASARVRQGVSVSPSGFTDNSEIVSLGDDHDGNLVFDHSQSGLITVHDGESFNVDAFLAQLTGVDPLNGGLDRPELRTNTASDASQLDYWISLSPGATLSSESGYLYTAPAPVPEPAPLAVLGLGGLALVRRRRVTR